MSKKTIVLTDKVTSSLIDTSDGGASKTFYLEDDAVFGVEIRSYDEIAWDDENLAHKKFNELEGKSIRVTIEILD